MPDLMERATYWREVRNDRRYDAAYECRTAGSDGYTFEGVASVVDVPYEVSDMWGTFTETVSAGAFDKTIGPTRKKGDDVGLFINHDTRGIPLASLLAGSLSLAADPNLRVKASLNAARSDIRDIKIAVDDRLLSQMSIGFRVPKGKDSWNADYTERQIHEVWLGEASIVWRGANPHTFGQMRSLSEMFAELKAGDLDETEIQRMIDHLSGLLPVKVEEPPVLSPVTADELAKFWAFAADPA